jgi:fibro-slime domain-containing protein
MKPVEEKYCGWFIAGVAAPDSNFKVYFKQTIGGQFVGAEGLTDTEPMTANEINLDSVAALSDTVWIKGNQEGAPGIYSTHPAGVLGDCVKKIPVMMFDWLHGNKGNGTITTRTNRDSTVTTTYNNGAKGSDPELGPLYAISEDFGSQGCLSNNGAMKGMVEKELGPNGVPVRATPFPENCQITDHLDYWFIPESLAVDANGNTLTNMTCRDLYISLDSTGFWLAEVSTNGIFPDTNRTINRGGMFLLDDFMYLDSAGTIPNPFYDQQRGGSDNSNHNFGFTMKFQATFEYVPGQYFDFLGDDDVWVFINNKLVVDIGGQHGQVAGSVDLDSLNLIPDSTYNFHIFYAERHTGSSNFRMRTSIDLKTEASILLQSTAGNSDIISKEIYQRVRKSKLSCDFSDNSKETKLERGASTFTLFGGNLPTTGVALDSAGLWYGGITINKELDAFSIDKEAIKEAHGLVPGVYYLRVALVADNSQHKDIYFVVGAWKVPDIAFTDSTEKVLGTNIVSDTLQLNLKKDTMWVGQSYKVYVQYMDSWAPKDDMIYISTNDEGLVPCDSLGNPLSEMQLVDGKASFYVKAISELWGGILYVKPMSGNTATWSSINFALPPVPQIDLAYMYDRDGDGRGDSIWVVFDGKLGGKNRIDSVNFTFNTDFNKPYKAIYNDGDSVASVVADSYGFGSTPFTGGKEEIYTGSIKIFYTYKDNGKKSNYEVAGLLKDRVGPIIEKAEVSYMKDGNTQLILDFSEALQKQDITSTLFRFHCWNNGIMDSTLTNEASTAVAVSATQWKLIFPKGGDKDIIPAVGDSVRFTPPSAFTTVFDLEQNRPHQNNPWMRITGEQKVNVTSPGVVTLDPEKNPEVFERAKEIIQSPDATVTKIIQDPSVLTAEQAAAVFGTQGHFLGNLDMAELVENEITDIVNAVKGTPKYVDEDDSTKTYALEEIFAMVDAGAISFSDAKDKFNLDPIIVDAYENGILTYQNLGKFQSGTEADIKQIVESVAETTQLDYKATYFSSLGEFVNSKGNTITCNSDIFKNNGQGTCLDNNGKLFLAWNMRAKNGRLASTGVYIARLEYRIKVGTKVIVNRTQDFLWGVRRGKINAIDLGL